HYPDRKSLFLAEPRASGVPVRHLSAGAVSHLFGNSSLARSALSGLAAQPPYGNAVFSGPAGRDCNRSRAQRREGTTVKNRKLTRSRLPTRPHAGHFRLRWFGGWNQRNTASSS